MLRIYKLRERNRLTFFNYIDLIVKIHVSDDETCGKTPRKRNKLHHNMCMRVFAWAVTSPMTSCKNHSSKIAGAGKIKRYGEGYVYLWRDNPFVNHAVG